jgi:Flp pilus assembly protein TadG
MLHAESTRNRRGLPAIAIAIRPRFRLPLRRARGQSARGQSVAEFALVLPVLLGLLGITLDLARVYEADIKLQAATRDAAEYAATDTTVTTSAQALTRAQTVICTQFGAPSSCTSPAVVVSSFSRSTAAPGSSSHPQVTVSLTSSLAFETLFPYPLVADQGSVTLSATSTFAILQGR